MKMKCTRALSPLQCIRSVPGEAVLLYVRMNIMKKYSPELQHGLRCLATSQVGRVW